MPSKKRLFCADTKKSAVAVATQLFFNWLYIQALSKLQNCLNCL